MLNQNVLIGIASCMRYHERRAAIRDTWLRRYHGTVVFCTGFGENGRLLENDIVTLDCEDTYEKLPHKMLLFFRTLLRHDQFDWMFKCDDDTYVKCESWHALLHNATWDYGGRVYAGSGGGAFNRAHHINKVTDVKFKHKHQGIWRGPWCQGGDGYFLSRRAVSILAEHIEPPDPNELYEDKMVGDILRSSGIFPTDLALPTLHPVTPHKMRGLYRA